MSTAEHHNGSGPARLLSLDDLAAAVAHVEDRAEDVAGNEVFALTGERDDALSGLAQLRTRLLAAAQGGARYRRELVAERDTNDRNANLGELALAVSTDCDTPATDVADLLANLMHACDRMGVDFDDALARAERHHAAEVIERDSEAERDRIRFPDELGEDAIRAGA